MHKLLLLLSIQLTVSLPHPIQGELKEYKLLLILKLYCQLLLVCICHDISSAKCEYVQNPQ